MRPLRIVGAGDAALIVELGDTIDPAVNEGVVAVAAALGAARLPGVLDIVPTYRTVAVYFDPLRTDLSRVVSEIERCAAAARPSAAPAEPRGSGSGRRGSPVRIPVVYGGAGGPDLKEVAELAGLAEDEVVRLHTARTYRVYMLGFVPGFAYMAAVDPRIAVPRRATPRMRVPSGSVAIAGSQTAVYPTDTPGGWRLIGSTAVRLFDLARPDPFLLQAGDMVQFEAVRLQPSRGVE